MRLFTIALLAVAPAAAQYCKPPDFQGAYGFQLSGTTTISGDPKSAVSVGRIEFDGNGSINGSSSVNFAGYFLGNPVTGQYELSNDCTLNWTLQDDSGLLHHFTGKLTSDLQRANFQQTDQGAPANGTLARVAQQCEMPALQGSYNVAISGSAIPMQPGDTPHQVEFHGMMTIDQDGNVALMQGAEKIQAGSAGIDSECILDMRLMLYPDQVTLRGVLVDHGQEILAMDTAPGTSVRARLLRQREP